MNLNIQSDVYQFLKNIADFEDKSIARLICEVLKNFTNKYENNKSLEQRESNERRKSPTKRT